MAPRISVLMPCFNHGAYIDEAIASVHGQTFQDFELIVVDDGSTDAATIQKLQSLSVPRGTVLRTQNRGLPAARNLAASHAAGDFLCALDADDRLAPTWFEKAVAALDADPSIAFVSHWLEAFGDERWTWKPERCDLPALLARNSVNGAALVRRAAFDAVGGYDESLREGCEDWDFWLRLVEHGFGGRIIPEVLFYYRRSAGSMSRVMLDQMQKRPLDALVNKHRDQYRTHLAEVIEAREAEARHLAHEVGRLERDRLTTLDPALERAREELAALADKVARTRARREKEEEHERLTSKAADLEHEVSALRGSWSWRLTAPLRALYARVAGGRR
jgi:glycosyltransferase involved in cell wall biosynthesis